MHVQAAELATLRRVDPVKAYPLAVHLNGIAVDHRGAAGSARAGVASRTRAMVSARMGRKVPRTLSLRSGAVIQAKSSSVLLCWRRLAARPAVHHGEHNQDDDHRCQRRSKIGPKDGVKLGHLM